LACVTIGGYGVHLIEKRKKENKCIFLATKDRMKNSTEVSLETILVTVLNVAAVYVATFTYRLNWEGVLSVMIFASLFTAVMTHFLLSKMMAAKQKTERLVNETLGVMGVALISSLAVLLILTARFNLPQALGISLLSGILTAFLRHFFTLP
jgi:hypothetical protein